MEHTLFGDLAIIVGVVVLLALVMRMLRQPAIISYIVAGVILSPYGLGVIHSGEDLEIFSQMGVSFLLFMVGLSLSPNVVRDVGWPSVITGAGQVMFTSVLGYGLGLLLGLDATTALYVAVALTFSSTIIIMKLLSDKGDLESLYGRIATGFLIIQDLIAMVILIAVTSFAKGGTLTEIALMTGGRLAALILTLWAGMYIVRRILQAVASSQELLLLFSIGWCLTVGAVCHAMGLSTEIGALAAGVTLSFSPYRFEISSKLKPLRDFFIVLFFVLLGSQMTFENFSGQIVPILAFSAFILIGNPLIVLILMGFMGYGKRTSFRAGLTVAQISEFSFILIALGMSVGHLSPDILSFITFVGLLTIAGSTYFILYADRLYALLERPLSLFERKGPKLDDLARTSHDQHDILLLGYERVGLNVLEALRKTGKRFLVVDYNPATIKKLSAEGIDCRYGDLGDGEFLAELNFAGAKMIVSTIREFDTTALLTRTIRSVNKKAVVIVLSQQVDQALHLYELGATYVITPQFLGGYHTSMLIEEYGVDLGKFLLEKARHVKHLRSSSPHGKTRHAA